METILVLNKSSFEILEETKIVNYKFISQKGNENTYTEIIDLIKDLVQLNNLLPLK